MIVWKHRGVYGRVDDLPKETNLCRKEEGRGGVADKKEGEEGVADNKKGTEGMFEYDYCLEKSKELENILLEYY